MPTITRHQQGTVSRDTQKPDTIYTATDEGAFVTPDGTGRYWYDSLAEAQDAHGDDLPVIYLDHMPDD